MTIKQDYKIPFYDPAVIKKATFSRWAWLWLWLYPTYVNIGLEQITFYKHVRGCIYILKTEPAPWESNEPN